MQSSLKALSFYAPTRSQKNLWDRKKKFERRSTQHVLRDKAKAAACHEKFLAWMNEAGTLVPEREELRLPWITPRRGPAMSPSVMAMPAYRHAAAADGVGHPAVRKSLPADLSRYREHLEMSENQAGLFLEGSPVVDVANILSTVDARAEEESRARDRKNVGMDAAAWHVAQEALAARGTEMDSEGKIFYTDKFTGWRVYLLKQQRTAKREELTCQESVPTLQTTSKPLPNKHQQVFFRVRETLQRKRASLADNLKNLVKLKEDARVRASELAADYRRGYEKQIQQQTLRLDYEIHQTHQQLRQRSMEIAAVDSSWRHQTPLAPSRTRASCHVGPNSPIDDDAAMQKGVTLAPFPQQRSSGRCAAGVGSSHLPEVEALPQSADTCALLEEDQDAHQSLPSHHVRELSSLSEGINSVVGRWKQTGWQVFEETEWRAVEEQERDGASTAGGKLPKGWTPVLDSPSLPR